MDKRDLDTFITKSNSIDNVINLFLNFFKDNNIVFKDGENIALAFFNHSQIYYTFKKLYPKVNFFFIEDISLQYFYDIENTFYVNLQKKEFFPNMKFDYIIMNPPYNGNLHLSILNAAYNQVKENGTVISIQPDDWIINKYIDTLKDKTKLNAHYNLGKYIDKFIHFERDQANALFGIASWFGVGIITLKTYETTFDLDQFKSTDALNNKIIKKIISMSSLRSKFSKLDNDNALMVPVRRNNHNYLPWVAIGGKATEGIKFDNQNQVNNFINSFNTWLYDYIKIMDWDSKENSAMIPYLENYDEPWTNERLFELFKLNSNEQKQIYERLKIQKDN